MARKKPPENAWVSSELERAGRVAESIRADEETRHRVKQMWQNAGGSLVSSAAAYRIGDPPTGRLIRPSNKEGWESECWAFYDAVGELHYVAGQNGRAVAQARLYIAEYDDRGVPREVEKGDAAAMSRDLLGGVTESSELKFALGVQGIITGQSLITVSDQDGWAVYSDQDFSLDDQEMKRANNTRTRKGVSPYLVNRGGSRQEHLPAGTLVIHLWDRHPGRAWQVDSSTRPALSYLRELCRLDEYVQSTLLSRIATAGILQVPKNATPSPPPGMQLPEGVDPLMHMLATVGQASISDPGSASAVLPILLSMPEGERLDHLTLDYELTSIVNDFREMNLRRVAISMDMAPETMSGFANVKYANAEFIQAESIRTHVVRRVAAIATALTKSYVRPALGDQYVVRWDLSDLEIKPDRTESAIALYDRGEIDGDTLRDMTGLREGTPPEGDELLRQIAYRAVTVNPSLLPAMAPLLGYNKPIHVNTSDSDVAEEDDNSTTPKDIPEVTPDNPESPDQDPDLNVRRPQPVVSNALVAACDVLVCGALGRAGATWRKRKRARINASKGTDTQALYLAHNIVADRAPNETPAEHAESLFGGRFSGVDRVAALYGADADCLQASLVRYTSNLLVDRRPHHPERLAEVVEECVYA